MASTITTDLRTPAARRNPLRATLFALLLALPAMAWAAPPSDAQVDELMNVMRVEQTLDAMWPQVEAMQMQSAQQATADRQLTPEQRAQMDAMLQRMMASLRETMAWDKLQPIYRDIYRKSFDATDVTAMLDFYTSPAGQNLLDKMPQLMQNTMTATQQMLMPALEKMQLEIQAEAARAAAQAEAAPPAAAEDAGN